MLSYLQNLLTNKQGMQTSQFGSNLDLQNRSLAQHGNEFDKQLSTTDAQFQKQLALEQLKQQQANALAQQQQALLEQGQHFNQGEQTRLNTTPGSDAWQLIQSFLQPNNAPFSNPNAQGGAANPIPRVTFTQNTNRIY